MEERKECLTYFSLSVNARLNRCIRILCAEHKQQKGSRSIRVLFICRRDNFRNEFSLERSFFFVRLNYGVFGVCIGIEQPDVWLNIWNELKAETHQDLIKLKFLFKSLWSDLPPWANFGHFWQLLRENSDIFYWVLERFSPISAKKSGPKRSLLNIPNLFHNNS